MRQLQDRQITIWDHQRLIADRDPQRAVELAHPARARAAHTSPEEQSIATAFLGYALLRLENLEEARQLLNQAAAQFAEQNNPLLALHARRDALFADMLLGKSDEATWKELAESYAKAGEPLGVARTQMYLCAHYNMRGRPRTALEVAAVCAPILEAQGTREDHGRMLRIKAAAHSDCGEFEQALVLAGQAVSIFRDLEWPVEIARSLTERAWHRQRTEQYRDALADLVEAHNTFTRANMTRRIAICELHLGLLSSRLGQYQIALALTQAARQRFIELGLDSFLATCDLNTGIIFYYAGLNEQAMRAYQHAEQVYHALGNQRMLLVSRRNQALVLRRLGRHHDALQLLDALHAEAEQVGDQNEQAAIYLAAGETLHDLKRYGEALDHLVQAQHAFNATNNPAAVAQCLLEQGWLLLKQRQIEEAQQHFEAALPALSQRPMHHWRVLHGQARCAKERGKHYVALNHYREVSRIIARLRTQLLSEHASSRIFAQVEEAHIEALNLAVELGDTDTVLELAETQRALSLGELIQRRSSRFTNRALALYNQLTLSDQQQYSDTLDLLVEHLIHQHHENTTIDSSQWLDLLLKVQANDTVEGRFELDTLSKMWSSAYHTGWTALIYVHCGHKLVVISCDAESPKPRMETITLDNKVSNLLDRAILPQHRPDTYYNWSERSKQPGERWLVLDRLAQALIPAHVQERLEPNRRLLIVPSAELHTLPWAALRVQGRWLAEAATIQLLPTLGLWPQLAERRAHHSKALLMGVSDFAGRKGSLPRALKTLDIAERSWRGEAEKLAQEEASCLRLIEKAAADQLRQYGLLHIATHAELKSQGLFANLDLADGELFYDDIVRLRLDSALVVLIVCNGAKVQVLKGEEILSLNRAFLAAGARDVIASMWPLYDSTVLELVEPLYKALQERVDAPTAVAVAQRALIAQGNHSDERSDFVASPLMWASLCAMGAGIVEWPSADQQQPADDKMEQVVKT
ncbi:MAG: hypothetical protein OHK0022_13650 [Roseiflexaceae bacterium]